MNEFAPHALITIDVKDQRFALTDLQARQIRDQLLTQLINDGAKGSGRRPLSRTAGRVLNFVHNHLELYHTTPSRQQIADYIEVDRKLIIPIMRELQNAGWRRPRDGHRSDDWGGRYQRPTSPPFVFDHQSTRPEMGELSLVQPPLFS